MLKELCAHGLASRPVLCGALLHSAFGPLDSIEMVTGTRTEATQQASDARFEMVVQEAR